MYFRPLPILTLVAVPILAALIALGVWQAQRAGWKTDLIAQFEATASAPPLSMETACSHGLAQGQVIEPPTGQGAALRMFGHDAGGVAGWRLFQTAVLCGRPIFLESGFEALAIGGPGGVLPSGAKDAPVIDRYIVEPWPEKPVMAASNSPERNEWHWFDAAAMVQAAGVDEADTRLIVTPFSGVPDFLSRTPPATHIGYSVTWFGMAIAFLVIYAVFHVRAGRLRFGKAKA
ncbi:MAG: SURF1 family protein [Hyphomonadaceae bacterium]